MAADPKRSSWWELEHSWWLFLIALSIGFLTWAAFGYIWLRTKARAWGLAAVGYLALLIAACVFLSYDQDTWQVGVGAIGLICLPR